MYKIMKVLFVLSFCIGSLSARDTKPTLYLVYSENCGYSQELLHTTLANTSVQKLLKQDFNYHLLEAQSPEAQTIINKFEITGVPAQVLTNDKDVLLSYGTLTVEEELNFLTTTPNQDNLAKVAQESVRTTPFGEHVFMQTGIGYNVQNQSFIKPGNGDGQGKNKCGYYSFDSQKDDYPDKTTERYQCNDHKDNRAFVYLDQREKGSFQTSVVDTDDKGIAPRYLAVAVTSFVEDSKVTQQSYCEFKGESVHRKSFVHNEIGFMKCYVVTPKLCSILSSVNSEEAYKGSEKFNEFKNVMAQPYYMEKVNKAYAYNFRKAFLHINSNVERGENYDKYSVVRYGNYENVKNKESLKAKNYFELNEESENMKSFQDFARYDKERFLNFYLIPCENMQEAGILKEVD